VVEHLSIRMVKCNRS